MKIYINLSLFSIVNMKNSYLLCYIYLFSIPLFGFLICQLKLDLHISSSPSFASKTKISFAFFDLYFVNSKEFIRRYFNFAKYKLNVIYKINSTYDQILELSLLVLIFYLHKQVTLLFFYLNHLYQI